MCQSDLVTEGSRKAILADSDLSAVQLADAVNQVEGELRAGVPEARMIELEPDVQRSGVDAATVATEPVTLSARRD